MRTLILSFFLTGVALAQPNPIWDSGEVRPAATGSHNQAISQLRVQRDWTRYTLTYQVSSVPGQINDTYIEVWDRPLLLFRQKVSAGSGNMLWQDDRDPLPGRLEIALLDPDFKPRYICFDECDPEDLKKTLPSSNLIVGIGPDGDPPYSELQVQSSRVVAGSRGFETVLSGIYLTPTTRLLVAEFDPLKRTYNHLQFLPFEFLDLYHLKVSVPSFLLQQPRVLVFSVMPPLEDHREQEPVFDGMFKGWLPGASYYSASLVVAQPESPAVDRLEPKDLHADADEFQNTSATGAQQSSYEEHGVHIRVHGRGFDRDSQVFVGSDPFGGQRLPTEFLSPQELRFWVESSRFKGSTGDAVTLWVTNQKDSTAISNPITFKILPASGTTPPVPSGEITVTEPYPIPLINQNGPREMEVTVRGKNFRPNVTVVASNDGGVPTNLKTLFVSTEELRAWLPQSMWRTHRLSFRLVVQTQQGRSAVEIQEPE